MTLVLNQQVDTKIPIDVDGITPDRLAGCSIAEIAKLPIRHGRHEKKLATLFAVSGSLNDSNTIAFSGNLNPVHSIGAQMTAGTVLIESNTGRHVGRQMSGGTIRVSGDVSDFLGVEMTGGTIRVAGNAGDLVGGHLPGSKFGMNRGSILVDGNVGKGAGQGMRRGTIVVGGNAGELLGWNMCAGTIIVLGDCGPNVGAEMIRGSIILAGGHEHPLLPSFSQGGSFPVPVLSIMSNWLSRNEFEFNRQLLNSSFQIFHGDGLKGGRGEVFIGGQPR